MFSAEELVDTSSYQKLWADKKWKSYYAITKLVKKTGSYMRN
jgi:hypothetical protein